MKFFLNFLKAVLIRVLIFIAIASAVAWFAGWRELIQYVNVLTTVGGLIILFGVVSILGDWKGRANFGYLYGRSAGKKDTLTYANNEINDTLAKYFAFIHYVVIGLSIIAFSIIIDKIFN